MMAARVSSFDTTLDTCVLLPITLCDTLLRFAEASYYRPHWSEETLIELERNLQKRLGLTAKAAQRRIAHMREAFPEAVVTGYSRLVPSMPNDFKDRHVLAAAVKSRSQVLVTANLKDFPVEVCAEFDVEPQHPDLFLVHQSDLDPAAATRIIVQMAQDRTRPPQSVANVLDRLSDNAPTFAHAMRLLLGLPTIRAVPIPTEFPSLEVAIHKKQSGA